MSILRHRVTWNRWPNACKFHARCRSLHVHALPAPRVPAGAGTAAQHPVLISTMLVPGVDDEACLVAAVADWHDGTGRACTDCCAAWLVRSRTTGSNRLRWTSARAKSHTCPTRSSPGLSGLASHSLGVVGVVGDTGAGEWLDFSANPGRLRRCPPSPDDVSPSRHSATISSVHQGHRASDGSG